MAESPHAAYPCLHWPTHSDSRPDRLMKYSRGNNAHKQPRSRRKTFGGAVSRWSAECTATQETEQANQSARFQICSCLCQSTGPSLPHCHSDMNSYCLGHFISSSYLWLVALKEVLSWRQTPENHLRSEHLPVSPRASSFQTEKTVMRKNGW